VARRPVARADSVSLSLAAAGKCAISGQKRAYSAAARGREAALARDRKAAQGRMEARGSPDDPLHQSATRDRGPLTGGRPV